MEPIEISPELVNTLSRLQRSRRKLMDLSLTIFHRPLQHSGAWLRQYLKTSAITHYRKTWVNIKEINFYLNAVKKLHNIEVTQDIVVYAMTLAKVFLKDKDKHAMIIECFGGEWLLEFEYLFFKIPDLNVKLHERYTTVKDLESRITYLKDVSPILKGRSFFLVKGYVGGKIFIDVVTDRNLTMLLICLLYRYKNNPNKTLPFE